MLPPVSCPFNSVPRGGESAVVTSHQPTIGAGTPDDGRVVMDETSIRRALMRIAHEILERCEDLERVYLVAIPNGGVPLARQLAGNFKQIADADVVVGVLDTTLYRDDLKSTSERPLLRDTEMPSAVDDRVVVLVDDVVKTGRTIRAAMDALMGRSILPIKRSAQRRTSR